MRKVSVLVINFSTGAAAGSPLQEIILDIYCLPGTFSDEPSGSQGQDQLLPASCMQC